MEGDVANWLRNIPTITRYLFVGSFAVTILANVGLVDPFHLALLPLAYHKLQIWRFASNFLFLGRFSPHLLFSLYYLYNYSRALEADVFSNRPADYLFFVLFCGSLLDAVGLFFGMPFLAESLTFSILYVWSQLQRDTIVRFFFGLQFKSMYLPWVIMAMQLLMGGNPFGMLLGVLVGHVYYYLKHIYPESSGRDILTTPQFLHDLLPNVHGVSGFAAPGQVRPPTGGAAPANDRDPNGGYRWGRGGNVLGTH